MNSFQSKGHQHVGCISEYQTKAALTGGLFFKSSSPFGWRAGNLFQPVVSFLGALQLSGLFQPSVFTQVVHSVWSVVRSHGCVTLIWVVIFLSDLCFITEQVTLLFDSLSNVLFLLCVRAHGHEHFA